MNFTEQDINEFKIECLEFLDTAEKSLLSLDGGGELNSNYDTIFRTFHNLKGSSGVMGLFKLQEHMHKLENLLSSYKGKDALPKDVIEVFLNGVDEAKVIINNASLTEMNEAAKLHESASLAATLANSDNDSLSEFLAECNEILARLSLRLQQFEKQEVTQDNIDSFYRDVHTLKGSAYLFGFNELGELGHAVETSMEPIRSQVEMLSPALIDALLKCVDLGEKLVSEIAEKKISVLGKETSLTIAHLKLVQSKKENIMTNTELDHETRNPANETTAQGVVSSGLDVDKDSNTSIRVPVVLLDKLMSLMGEMVLVRNQVLQFSNKTDDLEFLNLSQRLNVVTAEIQGEMMKTRMQPIGNVIGKFSRVIRDLSKDLGKKIELLTTGNETELDKTLLEAVKDPLVHIIRNACDHGIESPEERKSFGKSTSGQIAVHSYHEGGQVIVEVKDDGRGLDAIKLTSKAIEKGILTSEKAKLMTEREAFNLIFAPGFSTSAKVSNISGRGVGMDVVRTNVEKIGGAVELNSVTGKGTTIKLKIPLTLAIVPAMIVRSENDYFAIPQLKLVELLRVEQNSQENRIEFVNGSPIYRLRGNILPLVVLHKVLNSAEAELNKEAVNIVVLKSDGYTFGLIVDEIQDTADIVVKPLSRFLKTIQIFSGATVLGDGAIALILDVAGIVKTQIIGLTQAADRNSLSNSDMTTKKRTELQDFLLIKAGPAAKHAILLNYVHRLEEFKTQNIETIGKRKLVRYRDSILPLISVNEKLGYELTSEADKRDVISVIVIEKSDAMYGLVVDTILDVLSTEKELDTTITDPSGIIGNLVTDDEAIAVIDPFKLIDHDMVSTKESQEKHDDEGEESIQSGMKSLRTGRSKKSLKTKDTRILYVEDTTFFRKQVGKFLESSGYEVVCANDGNEGLQMLDNHEPGHFQLIISDIEMPNMNGFKFAEGVRAHKAYSTVPLIALSTKANDKHVQQGLNCGFDLYLEKLDTSKLTRAIEKLILKVAS